jgi:hypothetical protein
MPRLAPVMTTTWSVKRARFGIAVLRWNLYSIRFVYAMTV